MSVKSLSSPTVSVTAFLNGIGINGQANSTTAAQMAYLGITNLRTSDSSPTDLLAAAGDGAKIDDMIPWFLEPITAATLQAFLTDINPAASVIEAIEGPNEVNTLPDNYNGLTGVASVEAEQAEINILVKADNSLNNATKFTPVYDFSVLQGTPSGTYSGMQDDADYNNAHAYGGPGIPPSWLLPHEVTANTIAGTDPVVLTETGATTIPGPQGVDQATQARYDLKALLDAYQLGATKTYLYNIQDWATGSDIGNFSAYYGLYNTDGTIKLSGTAMHNFTTMLSQGDNNPDASPTLNYSLSGMAYYGNSELFAKGGGAFDLALWNETMDWNVTNASEVIIPTNNVTLNLATTFASISIYDPLMSSSPIKTITNASSITVALSDDPLIVQMVPQDQLVLALSEDAYNGDAEFTLTVDGKQVGGLESVNALHSVGANELFTFEGDWGSSQHTIGLSFINDAYAGPKADRNLYITSASYDSHAVAGAAVTMNRNATANFSVKGITPTVPAIGASPATVTIYASEDAWLGNSEFVLKLDGKAVTTPVNVSTLHSSSSFQEFNFGLNLSSGQHTIGVSFVNDAYGGSPSEDRNLYVGGIDVNGQHVGTGTTVLNRVGTATYTFTA